MSETQRKVCLYVTWAINCHVAACGRHHPGVPSVIPRQLGDIAPAAEFACLPRQAQCDQCSEAADRGETHLQAKMWPLRPLRPMHPDQSHASPAHILSVSLFCAGLQGSWPDELVALLDQVLAGDETAVMPLLDAAERMGAGDPPRPGEPGAWARVEREWLEVDGHEHVWLPYSPAFPSQFTHFLGEPLTRCTCGRFKHEEIVEEYERRVDRVRRAALQRDREQADVAEADIMQRYLASDPDVHL